MNHQPFYNTLTTKPSPVKSWSSKARRISGIGFIEIFVTLIVLTVGLLGLLALQSRSLSYSHTAYLNTQASMMAYDMLDRIIANPVYAISGAGYTVAASNIPSTYPTNCETVSCTPIQLAQYDINQWKFMLANRLPAGDGTITRTNTIDGKEYTITVFFDDSRGRGTTRQVVVRATL